MNRVEDDGDADAEMEKTRGKQRGKRGGADGPQGGGRPLEGLRSFCWLPLSDWTAYHTGVSKGESFV